MFKAATVGAMDMLQALVEAGADVNLCAHSSEMGVDEDSDSGAVLSPMRLPSKMQPASAAPDGLAVTPLQAAAAAGHAPAVQFLASNVRGSGRRLTGFVALVVVLWDGCEVFRWVGRRSLWRLRTGGTLGLKSSVFENGMLTVTDHSLGGVCRCVSVYHALCLGPVSAVNCTVTGVCPRMAGIG